MSDVTANPSDVTLSLRSRYRNTRVRKDSTTGAIFFGTWRVPPLVETKPPKKHKIASDEIDRPRLIAHREYGDGSLLWAIAVRNNILCPMIEMATFAANNDTILIPHIGDVTAALQNSSPNSSGTT